MTTTTTTTTIGDDLPFKKFRRVSWSILMLSLVIDTASHIRSFPSYNVVIGVWGIIIFSRYQNKGLLLSGEGDLEKGDNDLESATTIRSAVTTTTNENHHLLLLQTLCSSYLLTNGLSIFLDIIYCCIWGQEIVMGEVESTKFSLVLFVINIGVKMVAACYTSQIVIETSSSPCLANLENVDCSDNNPSIPQTTTTTTKTSKQSSSAAAVRNANDNKGDESGTFTFAKGNNALTRAYSS